MKSKSALTRIRILSICIFAASAVLVSKLYLVQIVHGESYSERADRQYVRPNQNTFNRGNIYFTTKEGTPISAATLKEGYTVVMNPKLVEDAESAYYNLEDSIPLDPASFFAKAAKKDDPYEEIAKRVEPEKAKIIEEKAIPGIRVYKERWRTYPGDNLASQVLGLIAFRENELGGRYGLEKQYDATLKRGEDGLYDNFFADVFLNVKRGLGDGASQEGDIVTSIEPTVEAYLESTLKGVWKQYQSETVGGIVMDPKTGKIFAMGSYPDFNPNDLADVSDPAVFGNPMVENVYEMGSIVKALTMAAGLDSGAVTANSTYDDKGYLELNGRKISNYDGKGRGPGTSMQKVLNESLNTGVAHVALKMGKEDFSRYMLDFGLGERTGIDLPSEGKGLVDNLKTGREIEQVTAAYGQGIAFTPVVMIRALSALGNGGYLPNPHVVTKFDYSLGYSKEVPVAEGKRIISKETSEEITRMLVKVVDEALLQGTVSMKNYSIAAKTGTAQIADPRGGYYGDRYLHSFFGYFPAYDPKFIILLFTVHPKNVTYASQTLTHPFIDMAKFLINYYEIPPDR